MKLIYSENRIIEGIRSKDNEIFSYLYSKYRDEIMNHVIRNSGTYTDAEEVLHLSIIKMYKEVQKRGFVLRKTFDIYFSAIYRNTWISMCEMKNEYDFTHVLPEMAFETNETEYEEYKKEIQQKVLADKFTMLGEDCREVLNMYYIRGLTMNEIAENMEYKSAMIAKNKKYLCLEYLKVLVKGHPIYKNLKLYDSRKSY